MARAKPERLTPLETLIMKACGMRPRLQFARSRSD